MLPGKITQKIAADMGETSLSVKSLLSAEQVEEFQRVGFLVLRGFASEEEVQAIRGVAEDAMHPLVGPVEYEADVHYPGAPESREDEGGNTSRRLLHAVARSRLIRSWATQPRIGQMLKQLMGSDDVRLCQNHHNCIMTKQPTYSSATHWHQDVRYWSFARPELISFWLALGQETPENGSLSLLPGSHARRYKPEHLDEHKFLKPEHPDNQPLVEQAVTVSLEPGDLLFFDCRTFHSAGSNQTNETKLSLVLTAHAADNLPTPGTRSSYLPALRFRSEEG